MRKYQELLAAYVGSVKFVEFWRVHGTWGDGKLDKAKAERKRALIELNRYVAEIHKCLELAAEILD